MTKNSKFLPNEYEFSHSYCMFLHDYLTYFVIYGEKNKLFDMELIFKSDEEAESFRSIENNMIWEWLEQQGYNDKLGELLLKSLFPALLADFCQFIYEALSCSERARLTVSYSLLRKPLKDNLSFFEWLLGDPEKLLTTLYNEPATELALHKITQRDIFVPIISKAIDRTHHSYSFNADLLYDLRFNKSSDYGFEQFWNKAIHLITTHKELKTEPQNINFIFSDDVSRETQWHHIYTRLPLLLFYATDICESIMILILGDNMPNAKSRVLQKTMGHMAWTLEIPHLGSENNENLPSDILEKIEILCPYCDTDFVKSIKVFKNLFEKQSTRCPICRRRIRLLDLVD